MCVCVYVYTFLRLWVHMCRRVCCVCSYTWRPTTDVTYLPQSLPTLFSEVGSLANSRSQGFSESSWSVCSEDHLSGPPERCDYRQATMLTQV